MEFLVTQDPDVLADKLLPMLQAPWRAETEVALAKTSWDSVGCSILGGVELPLLQSPQVAQCPRCRRIVFSDVFEVHQRTCAKLPVDKILEAEAALEAPGGRLQTKSPNQPAGRSSVAGRAPSCASSTARSPVDSGGSNCPGVCGPVDLTSFPQTAPPAKRSRSGPSGSRSGQRKPAPSAEAEQRRLQYERGLLTIDQVCGVKAGEKICLRPLNCKYHSVSLKRLVDGRTRPFDDLLTELNAGAAPHRKPGSRSGQRKVAGALHAAPTPSLGVDYSQRGGGGDRCIQSNNNGVGSATVAYGANNNMESGFACSMSGLGGGGVGCVSASGPHRNMGSGDLGTSHGMGGGRMGSGSLIGHGVAQVGGGNAPAIIDEQWRQEWQATVKHLFEAVPGGEGLHSTFRHALDPPSAWPTPMAVCQPMRRKRRLQAMPIAALHGKALPSQLKAGEACPLVQPEMPVQPEMGIGGHGGGRGAGRGRGGRGSGNTAGLVKEDDSLNMPSLTAGHCSGHGFGGQAALVHPDSLSQHQYNNTQQSNQQQQVRHQGRMPPQQHHAHQHHHHHHAQQQLGAQQQLAPHRAAGVQPGNFSRN